jgi:hypothetical protein
MADRTRDEFRTIPADLGPAPTVVDVTTTRSRCAAQRQHLDEVRPTASTT